MSSIRIPERSVDPTWAMPSYIAYLTALKSHWDGRTTRDEELFSARSEVYVSTFDHCSGKL